MKRMKPIFKKAFPIRQVLLAAFLLAGLLPTILITTLAFYEARTALVAEIKHDMQTRAAATADEIDRMMFERLQNVASWSRLEIMQDIRIGDVDKRLSKFLNDLKSSYRDVYVNLYVIDNNNVVIASSDPKMIGLPSAPSTPWLHTRLPQGEIYLAALTVDKLPISAEITDSLEGGKIGTLVAVFDWKQITPVLEKNISGRGSAALFDSNKRQLAMMQNWHEDPQSKKIQTSATAHGYQGFAGFSWQVSISQHSSETLKPVRHMGDIFKWMLAATVLLATIIAIPVASSITKPLAKLTAFANNFIREPSAASPPVGGPAEIHVLSKAFDKMIADLEQSEANLTRAAKLAVVGEMAAAMSHEIRTPLGILRSSAQVLLREAGLTEEGREVCGFIISETERLNKLVSTLIDSARPRLPEFVDTDISELGSQVAAMLRLQAEKKNITLHCKTDTPAIAACDREQITQVLLNLLLNAIQVLNDGGQILLQVRRADDHILISVADNGPGISAEQREQVFDPFYSRRVGGIGLGLAVVSQIVTAHQGRISVYASAMGGAEFKVELPISRGVS